MGGKCIKTAWAVQAEPVVCCSPEYGEKNDHVKTKDEAPQGSSREERKAPKKRLGQKKEPPEAFMASFFASVEIYQTKILVRYFPSQ